MKKSNIILGIFALAVLLVSVAQAEPANKSAIIAKQKEILSLAKNRYVLEGQNLDVRGKLIALAETTTTVNITTNQVQFKTLGAQLKTNAEKIKTINQSIKSKWDELKALKPEKSAVVAPGGEENIIK
jgi:hypothetical protein